MGRFFSLVHQYNAPKSPPEFKNIIIIIARDNILILVSLSQSIFPQITRYKHFKGSLI